MQAPTQDGSAPTTVRDAQTLAYMKLLSQLHKDIGEIHGEPILRRFRRWQTVKSPAVRMQQQDYDPAWADAFTAGAAAVSQALSGHAFALHHIGSTSVPGMASKPIIDMVLALDDGDDLEPVRARLSTLGYACWGNSPVRPDVDWLWHAQSAPVQRVIHLCLSSNPWIGAAINFRDYLRVSPDKRSEYMDLKQRLAAEAGTDLALYSVKKASLLYRFNLAANAWRAAQ